MKHDGRVLVSSCLLYVCFYLFFMASLSFFSYEDARVLVGTDKGITNVIYVIKLDDIIIRSGRNI